MSYIYKSVGVHFWSNHKMKGNHVSEANTKRAIQKNRRELVGLHITYSRLEKDCKEKCAFVDAERAHFLRHKHAIHSSQHSKGLQLLPTIVTIQPDAEPLGRIRASSDVTAERKTMASSHSTRRAFSARSHSTGTLQSNLFFQENAGEATLNAEHVKGGTLHLPTCTAELGLVSRKSGKFKILGFSVMTLAPLSNSINDSTRLEALDLPFNEHIVRRKIQSERDLGIKLNEVRNLRYHRTGRYTTR